MITNGKEGNHGVEALRKATKVVRCLNGRYASENLKTLSSGYKCMSVVITTVRSLILNSINIYFLEFHRYLHMFQISPIIFLFGVLQRR
jgi:hypothetical protein